MYVSRFNFRSGLRDMIHAHVKDLPKVLVNSSKAPATPKRASVKGNKKCVVSALTNVSASG